MKVIEMDINEVKPYENNPRINEGGVEATANSIKEFGWQQPLVVDKDHIIIVGHTRLKAAEKLGLKKVPVVVAGGLSEDQVKAYRLADNKTGELSDWNIDMLDIELGDIEELDMSDFGFDDSVDIFDDDQEVSEDEFDEEVPDEPKAKLGQIYQLGRHRLMCGDSTDPDQVATLLDGKEADLLITDPPYNVAYEGKTEDKLTIKNDKQEDSEFYLFLKKAFMAAASNMRPGASFYIWYSSSESVNFTNAANESGLTVHEVLIWKKNQMVLGRNDYHWQHEPCLYGWKNDGPHSWYSDRKQTTILEFDKPRQSKLHPTMKPILLFDYQMKNNTKAGDVVLDLFGGSGTTLIACEQNKRDAYLMELDPRYVDVIIKRWEEFTGEKAELVNQCVICVRIISMFT